jgi:hypothetical protein
MEENKINKFHDKIDFGQGINPDKRYIPFGKVIINKHKLGDNILTFRTTGGGSIKGFSSRRISSNLSNVIKHIIGGKIPNFNDLEQLTNEEKEYLEKVSRRAEISDKLSVPTPSKDQYEKDIHAFEVMKGEILSGNDSGELIKRFKIHLMKLSRNGTLPKKEVSEIMENLIDLGY